MGADGSLSKLLSAEVEARVSSSYPTGGSVEFVPVSGTPSGRVPNCLLQCCDRHDRQTDDALAADYCWNGVLYASAHALLTSALSGRKER